MNTLRRIADLRRKLNVLLMDAKGERARPT